MKVENMYGQMVDVSFEGDIKDPENNEFRMHVVVKDGRKKQRWKRMLYEG